MHPTGSALVEVRDLAKKYGEVRAVDGVSFEVAPGETFGLLGPNGAGKTTTLSMLAGLLAPDRGSIRVGEFDLASDPERVKAMLGVVPQETAIYEELSALENLRFWASLYGLDGKAGDAAVRDMLDRVGLSGRAKEPVRRFSGGMKRRLNLAMGLVHRPQVVLLDEPTVGIDPQARLNILDVVRETAKAGSAVLYTTHYLEEAESLCDRIGIMDHGELLAVGTLDELQDMVGEGDVVTATGRFENPDEVRRALGADDGLDVLSVEPERVVVAAAGHGGGARALARLQSLAAEVDRVSIQPPSLNGLFLKLTGRELRD